MRTRFKTAGQKTVSHLVEAPDASQSHALAVQAEERDLGGPDHPRQVGHILVLELSAADVRVLVDGVDVEPDQRVLAPKHGRTQVALQQRQKRGERAGPGVGDEERRPPRALGGDHVKEAARGAFAARPHKAVDAFLHRPGGLDDNSAVTAAVDQSSEM